MKKIDDLQEIVKIQNERFSLLEMQSKKTRNLALKDLQITKPESKTLRQY